jgi:hypothetical protein
MQVLLMGKRENGEVSGDTARRTRQADGDSLTREKEEAAAGSAVLTVTGAGGAAMGRAVVLCSGQPMGKR